ncbi:uncharacterized protein LOC105180854 isoform X2 [Harpegnathos saltator]|uniref:uncharacterized protein LOC105180854 isoform X2 n=1 Tax=Harpegnathos saltator TaxID=610380 RepID=UPI000DBEE1D9|nr:uncharacterized protein LOC105180854 isoform X2 [Harpegnathos saltator]
MKFLRAENGFVSKRYRASHGGCANRIKPFLLLIKLCGMFANEITKGRVKRCSWPIYGICVFWLSLYVSHVCFLLCYFAKGESIQITLTIEFTKHLIGYASLGVNVIAAYTAQDSVVKFFDRLDSYDSEVARMKNTRQDHLWILSIATFATFVINLMLASVIASEITNDIMFFMILSDIFTTIMHMCGTLGKSLMLYLLLERFRHLNRKIAPSVSWDEKRHGSNAIKVLDVKTLHSMLYDAQQAFCNMYNNPMLMWFASLMIHVVANIRAFRQKPLILACALVCPGILQVFALCTMCHYTTQEANRIACVLNEDMCRLVSSGETMVLSRCR